MSFTSRLFGSQPWKRDFSNISAEDDLDAEEKFLDSSSVGSTEFEDSQAQSAQPATQSNKSRYLTALNVLVFCGTVFVSGSSWWSRKPMNACVRETSYYSPIFDAKPIEFHDVHLNGTLWPPEDEPWSRRVPGDPEAEKIWEDWEPVDTFPITREQVIALGKDPETAAKYPDDYWGMGDDAYIASLDVLHKIHCVNELRKMTFADYGEVTPAKKYHGKLWFIHLRHCVDMVVQDMLCHADADLITYNWRDTQQHPFPDFGINRKCRSMDPLLEYRNERRVDMDKYVAMPKPKHGINQIPYEPGYYAMYGFDGSDLFPDGVGYTTPLPDINKWFGKPPSHTPPTDHGAHEHEH